MKSYLKHMRQKVEQDLQGKSRWQYFSPAIYAQYRVMLPVLQKHARGALLDIGCGNQPYRRFCRQMSPVMMVWTCSTHPQK